MDDVVYLTVDDVIAFHADLFGLTDEQAADRLRDRGGLESALGRSKQHAYYSGADLSQQAAVLAHGIAEGQFFVDGNKRTATIAFLAFLRLNGVALTCPQPELAQWILDLSADLSAETLAERIAAASVADPLPGNASAS